MAKINPGAFSNSQEFLNREAPLVRQERARLALEGLVGGLAVLIINTEPQEQQPAVAEFLRFTGYDLAAVYEGPRDISAVLKAPDSIDIIVHSRRQSESPFLLLNDHPKSRHLPNTRLETLLFVTPDLARYHSIQKSRGVQFMTPGLVATANYAFIQTQPSPYTGTSLGFIQWLGRPGDWGSPQLAPPDWPLRKPPSSYGGNVRQLDHVATRLPAADRDAAILELMALTNYNFDQSFYIEGQNSITNVLRRSRGDAALVVTSGIQPYVDDESSGPTEKFVQNYGARAHHLAFWTERIDETFAALKADGLEFMIELVGSPEEGLKQTFTQPSPRTLLVHEYIYRYGTFDGFFTRSNVTALTAATAIQ